MDHFIYNDYVVKMLVPNTAKRPAAGLNSTMITYCGVPTGTEERDNRSQDFIKLFV